MKRANKSLIINFSECFTGVHTGSCWLPLKISGIQRSYAQAEKKTRTRQKTMKLNIKLYMENLAGEMTAIHSLPTRLCFNFLPTAQTSAKAKSKEPIPPALFNFLL